MYLRSILPTACLPNIPSSSATELCNVDRARQLTQPRTNIIVLPNAAHSPSALLYSRLVQWAGTGKVKMGDFDCTATSKPSLPTAWLSGSPEAVLDSI